MTRAETLRQAQLGLVNGKRNAHPFYWAPFAIFGDGGRLASVDQGSVIAIHNKSGCSG